MSVRRPCSTKSGGIPSSVDKLINFILIFFSPTQAVKFDPCYPNPCSNNGNCAPLVGENYQCKCPSGPFGISCFVSLLK